MQKRWVENKSVYMTKNKAFVFIRAGIPQECGNSPSVIASVQEYSLVKIVRPSKYVVHTLRNYSLAVLWPATRPMEKPYILHSSY